MVMFAIQDIEDAFIAALTPLKTAGTVRTLKTLTRPLDFNNVEEQVKRFPALLVTYAESKIQKNEVHGRLNDVFITIHIYAAAKSLKLESDEDARHGTPDSNGVYDILDQVRSLLHRQTILTGWQKGFCTGEEPANYKPESKIVIFQAAYVINTTKAT